MLHVVADSSCDLFDGDFASESFDLVTVPFTVRLEDVEFVDDVDLDVDGFVGAMEECAEAGSSSCPSPQVWVDQFNRFDEVIAVTISKNLSGSFASAEVAKDLSLEKNPNRKLEILDCRATGPAALMAIRNMAKWADEGVDFYELFVRAENCIEHTKTVFALCSYENLIKNGRVSRLAGLLAKALKMWGVGIEVNGAISMKSKVKGKTRALHTIIKDMEERGFTGAEVVISHCQNADFANKLRDKILKQYPVADVYIAETRGLDSFYAERGGIIVSYR